MSSSWFYWPILRVFTPYILILLQWIGLSWIHGDPSFWGNMDPYWCLGCRNKFLLPEMFICCLYSCHGCIEMPCIRKSLFFMRTRVLLGLMGPVCRNGRRKLQDLTMQSAFPATCTVAPVREETNKELGDTEAGKQRSAGWLGHHSSIFDWLKPEW